MSNLDIERRVGRYEGLVKSTAARNEQDLGIPFDELVQAYRIKVWRALEAFDPSRSTDEGSFVFGCLVNYTKDLAKRKRDSTLFIEDILPSGGDRQELRESRVEHEQVFGSIEDGLTLPPELDEFEKQIVLLLYAGRTQLEAARALGVKLWRIEQSLRLIRCKLAEWRPTGALRPLSRRATPPEALDALRAA